MRPMASAGGGWLTMLGGTSQSLRRWAWELTPDSKNTHRANRTPNESNAPNGVRHVSAAPWVTDGTNRGKPRSGDTTTATEPRII